MGQNFCIPDESPKNNPFEIDGQEIETTLKQSKINECLPNDYEKKQITQ